MGIKKTLALGVATAALGFTLVGGGTYAYFSSTTETSGTFASGTLDLSASPTTIINVSNIKPGDKAVRNFKLVNNGTLDIGRVLLSTDYTVTNRAGAPENTDDFGNHIRVNFLVNADKGDRVIYSTTLAELKKLTPDAVENKVFVPWLEERGGLKAGTSDLLTVEFEFVDNNADQNQFQGDALQLTWKFEAKQGKGEQK
ncbi:cell division protein FtsN [Paenibacillus sp. CAA11]|uniref:TasA family protein n=1 Tax=Paenibacillus sp. CAA11 TaxID=1532905 RepID=UPI000D3CDD1F|nr:TasA family protein [Paenibacillus sp. CAA11]AWB45860.1 cell division protein FtsN [Paenibacillus sp. CAA11]